MNSSHLTTSEFYIVCICFILILATLIGSVYLAVKETRRQKRMVEERAESIGKAFESIGLIAFSIFREVSERKSDKRTK
jgi:cytochrome bd-type quinol oxidase subunit 2